MPSPGVFGHRQQLELNKNFCKFLICSICKRKKLSRIEIIRNPLIGFFTFGDSMFDTSMSNPLSGRHFRWRSLRRPRPPVHVSSLRPWIEFSNSGWLRLVDLVDLVDSFAGHLSRTFRTAQDLSGTNSWNSCFRKRPKQNDPMNQSKRQTCSSFANIVYFLCLMCDSGGVSRSWWIVYVKKSWSLSSWDSSLRTLTVMTLAREGWSFAFDTGPPEERAFRHQLLHCDWSWNPDRGAEWKGRLKATAHRTRSE